MKRNLEIDSLRGLACLFLVMYHVIGQDSNSGLKLPDGDPIRQLNDAFSVIRMPLFAFLSGQVYAARPFSGNWLGFVQGKVRRLLVPMLVIGTAFALLQANTPGANGGRYDWSMLHIRPVAHYWFLEALFIIFVVIALLERFNLLSARTFLATWLLVVAFHLAFAPPPYFGLFGASYLLPYFLLGVWRGRFGAGTERLSALVLAGCLLVVGLVSAWRGGFPEHRSLEALLIGGGGCVLLSWSHMKAGWLAWIGGHSFAIFLFHPVFTAACRIGLIRAGGVPLPVMLSFGLVAGVAGSILLGTLMRRFSIGRFALGESAVRKPGTLERSGAVHSAEQSR